MSTKSLSVELLQQAVDTVHAHGSVLAAARILSIPRTTLQSRIAAAERAKLTPQVQGFVNNVPAAAPEGYMLKGTSTLYDGGGEIKQQWIKTQPDLEKLRLMQEAAWRTLSETLVPIAPIKAPRHTEADLATLYTMTDCHVGMLAWDKEAGENWDLEIAEACLVSTFTQMINAAPASAVGIINQLGDFLHFDSLRAETPTSHHILDADSRYQKVVEVAVRILRRVIEHALTKHKHVQVFMHEGNHDPAGSVWLRIMFAQLYGNNPRVTVEKSPNPYIAYQHGETLLGFHHGHLSRGLKGLPLLFAAKYPAMWGTTKYRYIHTGHLHHTDEKEHPGIKVIQHPTLAANDAYGARAGFLSQRQATSMTYHKTRGEVARGIFIPDKD